MEVGVEHQPLPEPASWRSAEGSANIGGGIDGEADLVGVDGYVESSM
ncbi:hypothetical protein ACFWFQ_32925 [Nocardia salmonicida]